MDLFCLFLEMDLKRNAFIMSKIYKDDAKISHLVTKLTN